MLLALEDTDNESHDYLLRRLAVESTTASDVFSLFKRLIPKSSELLRSYLPALSQLKDNGDNNVKFAHTKERQLVLSKVSKVSFIAYEDTLIYVPEGFKGKMIPYLEVLLAQSKNVLENGKAILQEYNTELAIFLSNSDIRKALKSNEDRHKKIRKDREYYQAQVNTFFDTKNATLSRRKLGEVMERFSDLDQIYVLEQKLLGVQKSQDYSFIISEIQKAADMLTLIKARLDDGSIDNVSGQTAKNIADGAYEIAKYAEYMALYGFYVENALASIRNTSEQLTKLFGK